MSPQLPSFPYLIIWSINTRYTLCFISFLLYPGLVHRTHMSSCRVDKPSEIVDVGDKVWVKLIGREVRFCATFTLLERPRKSWGGAVLVFHDGECGYIVNCGWWSYFWILPLYSVLNWNLLAGCPVNSEGMCCKL